MSQWKAYANTSGAPKWGAQIINQGAGAAAKASNNTALVVNTTPGVWRASNATNFINEAIGVFPVTPQAKANTSGESGKVHALGWNMRKGGEGPVISAAAANGSGFANGDTVTVSGGSSNAILKLTTNASGNLVSASIFAGNAGLLPNTANATITINRDQHVANLNFANSTALTNVGNANTINVSIAANSTTNTAWTILAFGSLTSNSTGGITNTQTQAITWQLGNNAGIFSNAVTNTSVIVTFTNANGSVVGGTYTATANLVTSTGGTVNALKLGGRAGRVTYESLAVVRHMVSGTSTVANSAQLPQ